MALPPDFIAALDELRGNARRAEHISNGSGSADNNLWSPIRLEKPALVILKCYHAASVLTRCQLQASAEVNQHK